MKKILHLCAICTFSINTFAQDLNSASWLNSVLEIAVQNAEKEKAYVVHAETGIFTINKSSFSDYTSRTLFQGTTYTVTIFTDPRIEDFKLLVWKMVDNKWQRYDSINTSNRYSLNIKGIGDRERIKVNPPADGQYAFELISASSVNKTGRYAVMVEAISNSNNSTTNSSTSNNNNTTEKTGKFFVSTDTLWSANLKVDNNNKFQTDGQWSYSPLRTLFEINPAGTVIVHTTPDMTSSYFVQSKSNDGVVFTYEVKSDAGNTYTFKLDTKGYVLNIYGKSSNGQWFVRSWHVRQMWKE
ncbi:MAG: hypothetical protein JST68_02385 [Bacteroidetes bacterium]|nr:hypothetical protein [Bacteroidota bacterium]